MCYHATQESKVKRLEEHYSAKRSETFEIEENDFFSYHLAAYNHPEMLIIPQESKDELHPALWGILSKETKGYEQNSYYKKYGVFVCNAKSEKLFTYDLYKDSAFSRRCIIPITGFFEPHSFMGVSYPFHFRRYDNESISVAGIYQVSRDGTVSMTMLTKEGSELFNTIHNHKKRQIVILDKDLEQEWLRDDLTKEGIESLINIPYPEESLKYYPTSRDIFFPSKSSNHEGIITRVEYPEFAFNVEIQKYLQ